MPARKGRPPKPKDEVLMPINFRATKEEKVAFLRTASLEKLSLSKWIRQVLISKSNSTKK